MLNVTAVSFLAKIGVAALIVPLYAWRAYWPEIGAAGALTLIVPSFVGGCAAVSIYFLSRYRHELTPAGKAE